MLRNVRIKTRIIAALAALSVLVIITGLIGLRGIEGTSERLRTVAERDIKHSGSIQAIRFRMEINRSQVLQALQHNPAMEWHKLHDHQLAVHQKAIADTTAEIASLWDAYVASIDSQDERRLAETWHAQSGGLGAERIGAAIKAISEERWDNAESILIKDINPTYRKADVALKALEDALGAREKERSAIVADDIVRIKGMTAAVIIGSLLLAAAVGMALVRSITIPLTRSVEVARRVAQGDLTCDIEVSSTNEIGQLLDALKTMNSGLTNIVNDVRSATELIGTASNEIASGNMDLSSRTEQQASSLAETASSMEQLTGTVQQNGENARHANQLAQSASEVAVRGGAVVSEVVSTMGTINDSARKIFDIISVIDGIAFQTNILALNAAVEAARAGDQGRGFAVVASEVRSLAQRSASAAKEIKALIGDSVEKVEAGTRLVDEAGATMHEIVASVKRVTDIMAEIASASEEQSTGIEQIGRAITQMDQVTQQNAALVEQAAAAAAAMETQAQHLAQAISIFRLHDSSVVQPAAVVIPVAHPVAPTRQPARVAGGRRLQSIPH